jgi:hypothetical protein
MRKAWVNGFTMDSTWEGNSEKSWAPTCAERVAAPTAGAGIAWLSVQAVQLNLRSQPHWLNALFWLIRALGEHHRQQHEPLNLPVAKHDADRHWCLEPHF